MLIEVFYIKNFITILQSYNLILSGRRRSLTVNAVDYEEEDRGFASRSRHLFSSFLVNQSNSRPKSTNGSSDDGDVRMEA